MAQGSTNDIDGYCEELEKSLDEGVVESSVARRRLFSPLKEKTAASEGQEEGNVSCKSVKTFDQHKSPARKKASLVMTFGRTKVTMKPVSAAEQLTLVTLQVEMRSKLESIERLLTILRALRPSQKVITPKDLPNRPLKTLQEFNQNEEYLDDKANRADTTDYLSKFVVVGVSIKDQVYSLLRKTVSDGLATMFNWKGTRKKLAFSESFLCRVITGSMMDAHRNGDLSVSVMEGAIKEWLKHTPKRFSPQSKKSDKGTQKKATYEEFANATYTLM